MTASVMPTLLSPNLPPLESNLLFLEDDGIYPLYYSPYNSLIWLEKSRVDDMSLENANEFLEGTFDMIFAFRGIVTHPVHVTYHPPLHTDENVPTPPQRETDDEPGTIGVGERGARGVGGPGLEGSEDQSEGRKYHGGLLDGMNGYANNVTENGSTPATPPRDQLFLRDYDIKARENNGEGKRSPGRVEGKRKSRFSAGLPPSKSRSILLFIL